MKTLLLGVATVAGFATLASKSGIDVSHGAAAGAAIFVVSTLLFKILRAMIYPYWFSPLRNVPTPGGGHFLLGHGLKLLLAEGPFDYFRQWNRQWPEAPFIRYFSFGNSEILIPNNLEAIRAIMHTHAYVFDKSPELKSYLKEFMGGGILFAMGEQHKRLRKVLAGPIARPNVRKLLDVFQNGANNLAAKVDRAIYGPENGVLEVETTFSQCILDVIGIAIIGKELNSFRSRAAGLSYEDCYRTFIYPSTLGKFIMFFNALIPLRWIPIEENRKYFEANNEMRSLVSELIRERTAEIMAAEKTGTRDGRTDMLTKMIQANISENCKITDKELMDTVCQLIMAGHETTSGVLSWATREFVQRPDMVARLRQEIAQAQEIQPELDAVTIENLPYLNNVIREILRLYTPTIVLHWEPIEDLVISDVRIPKGTPTHIVPSMIHQNKLIWGEDCDNFDPDRWERLNEASGNVFAFEAFINGPRICPGLPLAMLEMKVFIISLVTNFDFELADTVVTFDHPTLSLKAKGGLNIRFRRRLQQQ
ncbi:Cytochrome P450 monooxygenase FSL4-like protein [Cladobotryum mycophilum]|uniref:Cytochrome P450 monooxygenase FSL4-like protein n=1 Tax=Cladobotryum mycophilum TaxID=491253 RepID=A0ABR0SJK4_9HYPO